MRGESSTTSSTTSSDSQPDPTPDFPWEISYLALSQHDCRCFVVRHSTLDQYSLMKRYDLDVSGFSSPQLLLAAVESQRALLASIVNPHIIKPGPSFIRLPYCYVFQDLPPNGFLLPLLADSPAFPEPQVAVWFHQLVTMVAELHDAGVVHADLRLENLTLGSEFQLQLGGFLRAFSAAHVASHTFHSISAYSAPELFTTPDISHPFGIDIWSLGVILCMLLSKNPPWSLPDNPVTSYRFSTCNFPSVIQGHALSLLRSLFVLDASKRPSARSILMHPFFEQCTLRAQECPYTTAKSPLLESTMDKLVSLGFDREALSFLSQKPGTSFLLPSDSVSSIPSLPSLSSSAMSLNASDSSVSSTSSLSSTSVSSTSSGSSIRISPTSKSRSSLRTSSSKPRKSHRKSSHSKEINNLP